MLHIVLYQPEIPPNTGNIMRLAANCRATLHLIHPLGFTLEERKLRRAGLDYRDFATLREHRNLQGFLSSMGQGNLYAFSTKASCDYTAVRYLPGDYLLFGPETRGLPDAVRHHEKVNTQLRIPMLAESRSLNLSNSVAIAVYEAWRQLGFIGAADPRGA